MHQARPLPVEGKICLPFPIKLLARHGHLPVALSSTLHSLGDISRMSRNTGGENSLPHVIEVGQREMLGGSDIAEKISPGSGSDSRTTSPGVQRRQAAIT